MKKTFISFFVAGVLLWISACKSQPLVENGDAAPSLSETGQQTSTPTPNISPMPDVTYAKVAEGFQNGKSITLVSEDEKSCTIELGISLEKAESLLQTANFAEPEFCQGGIYTVALSNSIRFQIEEHKIKTINVSSPLIKTEHGLRVGDFEERIIELYGKSGNREVEPTEGIVFYTFQMDEYILEITVDGYFSPGGWGDIHDEDEIALLKVSRWHISLDERTNISLVQNTI